MSQLIDIGANLTHESFHNDFDEVLARARHQDIIGMVVTGASRQGSREALRLAQQHKGYLFATAGIHPHHAAEADHATMGDIKDLTREPEVRAVGETGLDFFRDFCPRDVQTSAFERHIELAIDTGLPMFLHERDAYPRFAEVLRLYRDQLADIVVHCFTGEKAALHAYLDMDCHIGITGWICDERRGSHLADLVADIPLERLMLETDAPYLMPRNIAPKPKSRRNEPQYLPFVCRYIADTLHCEYSDVAAATTRNARRFFGLPHDHES